MAKVRNNIIIQGLSGSLGEQLVIKQDKAGRTIVGVAPSFDPNRTYTEAQTEQHEKFRDASIYAKGAKDEEIYVEKAEGTPINPYNVAMADWFHAPEVTEIDAEAWSGQAGQVIRIQAVDNVQVILGERGDHRRRKCGGGARRGGTRRGGMVGVYDDGLRCG